MSFFLFARREKVYGSGRPRPCDTEGKRRIMARARLLMQKTQPGRAYGLVTPKMLAVLEALVWRFHNARTGLCFPSIKTLAAVVKCSPTTVQEALRRLEELGLISWVHRLRRVIDNLGRRRPVRASNGYQLHPPAIDVRDAKPAKSNRPATDASLRHGTQTQDLFSWNRRSEKTPAPAARKGSADLSDFSYEQTTPIKGLSENLLKTAAWRAAFGG